MSSGSVVDVSRTLADDVVSVDLAFPRKYLSASLNRALDARRRPGRVIGFSSIQKRGHMNAADVNARIDQVEKTLDAIVPAVAQGAAIIRLVGGLIRGKMSPDQQKQFDQAIAEYDAQNQQLQGAIDRLRAASSSTAGPTGQTLTASGQSGTTVVPDPPHTSGQSSSSSSGSGSEG